MSAADVIDPTKTVSAPELDQGGVVPVTKTVFEPRLIHVLQDGFTAFAQVWYRGQEIEVDETHFKETVDRSGNSWMDMTELEQMRHFKTVMFKPGPWPFDDWEEDEAKKAEQERARRPRLGG